MKRNKRKKYRREDYKAYVLINILYNNFDFMAFDEWDNQ